MAGFLGVKAIPAGDITLLALLGALGFAPLASAMDYGEGDRESHHVEDRRTGPGSLSNAEIARECQKTHIQPSYTGAAGILADSLSRLHDATVYVNHAAGRVRRLAADTPAGERAIACIGIALRADYPEALCKECEAPAVQAKCQELFRAVENLKESCEGKAAGL